MKISEENFSEVDFFRTNIDKQHNYSNDVSDDTAFFDSRKVIYRTQILNPIHTLCGCTLFF